MPLHATPRLLPLGDGAVTVQFGDEVSEAAHALVVGFTTALEAAVHAGTLPGIVEWVPAYASVTVIVDDARDDASTDACDAVAAQRDAALLRLACATRPQTTASRRWLLPVCFDADLAPDLSALAAARGLTVQEAVAHLLAAEFHVCMLGFMPGFPYMGGVPPELEVPRLSSPRLAVPPRSIAVAGRMCGIYPWPSPGGWHLVGRTPVRPFDVRESEPALLLAGDRVRFRGIDRHEFDTLEARAESAPLDRGAMRTDTLP